MSRNPSQRGVTKHLSLCLRWVASTRSHRRRRDGDDSHGCLQWCSGASRDMIRCRLILNLRRGRASVQLVIRPVLPDDDAGRHTGIWRGKTKARMQNAGRRKKVIIHRLGGCEMAAAAVDIGRCLRPLLASARRRTGHA